MQVPSRKVGSSPREGVVTGVVGAMLRVRWSTGEESMFLPSMGSLTVVGEAAKAPAGTTPRRPAKSTAKQAPKTSKQAAKVAKTSKQAAKATARRTTSRAAKKRG